MLHYRSEQAILKEVYLMLEFIPILFVNFILKKNFLPFQ